MRLQDGGLNHDGGLSQAIILGFALAYGHVWYIRTPPWQGLYHTPAVRPLEAT